MFSFASFELDLESERIWRHGEELRLRRKPFAILRYLVERPHRLVTREELVEGVWGRKLAMSESLLRTHVRDLRQVLGDGVVETVVGRGYRFVPEVTRSGFVKGAMVDAATRDGLVRSDAEHDAVCSVLRRLSDLLWRLADELDGGGIVCRGNTARLRSLPNAVPFELRDAS